MKRISLTVLFILLPLWIISQEDLLDEIDKKDTLNNVEAAFKGLKIINLESTKLASHKDLYLVVSHRFGSVSNGFDDFFGLDNAVTRLHLIYGLSDGWNIGVSRSSYQKTYEVNTKYRLVRQREAGFPFTLVGFNSVAINSALEKEVIPGLEFSDRLSYVTQILVSRKFSERFSFLIAPTFFYDNYLPEFSGDQDKSQFAVGLGGRLKISKRISINADYAAHLNRAGDSVFEDPLSIGVDIETGGHVFQLHFTNAQPSFESGFLGQANGSWGDGEFFFGFNLSRVF